MVAKQRYNTGMQLVLGIDEVGRGCWAGPLVAGAVVLGVPLAGLRDSKKLSARKRAELATVVHATARGVGLGWVTPKELDAIGMTAAVRLAMVRAVEQVAAAYDHIIIDGTINYLQDHAVTAGLPIATMVRADDAVPAVSAASIVAKVARDTYMQNVAADFPLYGFDTHVGYGTARHLVALQTYGACALHRRSFKPVQRVIGGAV